MRRITGLGSVKAFVGILEPQDGRHLTVEEMNEAIGDSVVESFRQSVEK